jgi:hypothetical protein
MPFAAPGSLVGAAVLATLGAFASAGCSAASSDENLGRVDTTIIGGRLDTTHRAVVSILKEVDSHGFFPACSGTLLTQNLILTAHHCVADLSSQDGATVECGVTEFGPPDRPSDLLVSIEANVGQEGKDPFVVDKIWLPPNVGSGVCGNDIALLLLSGDGIPPSDATPIEPALSNEVVPNDIFAAIGYGLQDPNDEEGRTLGHRMSVNDAQVYCTGASCRTPTVMDREWEAESPICSGDSGGPALDQSGRVAGVTSRGDPECTRAIYSSVYAWRDFIRDSVVQAATIGQYAPPAWAGEAAVAPTNPLGQSCTGPCPSSYLCWSSTAQPPGICVPPCGDGQAACPADYTCESDLGACIPKDAATAKSDDSSDGRGCSVGRSAGQSGLAASWTALALLGLGLARRRVRRSRRA